MGAVPAVTGVLDGRMIAGVEEEEVERILAGDWKLAERDLPIALARRASIGVSTVSATVAIAHLAGIRTFATGGIGGVHRGAESSFDVSSDLGAMARHPVIVVPDTVDVPTGVPTRLPVAYEAAMCIRMR